MTIFARGVGSAKIVLGQEQERSGESLGDNLPVANRAVRVIIKTTKPLAGGIQIRKEPFKSGFWICVPDAPAKDQEPLLKGFLFMEA